MTLKYSHQLTIHVTSQRHIRHVLNAFKCAKAAIERFRTPRSMASGGASLGAKGEPSDGSPNNSSKYGGLWQYIAINQKYMEPQELLV